MRYLASVPVHLLIVAVGLALAWSAAGCAGNLPPSGSALTPVASGSTSTAAIAPTSSVSAASTSVSSALTPAALLASTVSVPARPTLVARGGEIAFQTLAKGFRLTSVQSVPAVRVAVDAQSRDDLAALIAPEHQSLLKNVDLEREIVLAVFAGIKPAGGFSITVDKVSIVDAEVTVNVTVRENDAAVPKIEASTLPYHLVTIERSSFAGSRTLRYRLVNAGAVLVEGNLP